MSIGGVASTLPRWWVTNKVPHVGVPKAGITEKAPGRAPANLLFFDLVQYFLHNITHHYTDFATAGEDAQEQETIEL